MSEIIESEGQSESQVIKIEGIDNVVSIKQYQDIYHQITGRTENIRQRYTDNLKIDFSEIEQLHFKIMQLCDVHDIVAKNEVITVFHEKERKEQFTSFERFKNYNQNATKPTLNVHLKYNFSIIPAGLERPQEYVVSVRLTSRVAMIKQVERDSPPYMRGRFSGFTARHVAEISVDYADYVLARSFLESFDEWVSGCSSETANKTIEAIQKWSYLIPMSVRVILSLIILKYALTAIPLLFTEAVSLELAVRFIVISGIAFYIIMNFANFASQYIEIAIDSVSGVSYLKLNKGDDKLISEIGKDRKKVLGKFIFGSLITIVLGVISSKISSFV